MVLAPPRTVLGAPAGDRPPLPRRARSRGAALACERGSQALEFALTLPAAGFVLALVLGAGLVGMDLVHAQGIAREAARAAAVDGDGAAESVARAAAGRRDVRVTLHPPERRRRPGDLVTAEVRLRSGFLDRIGVDVALPARATMRVERG